MKSIYVRNLPEDTNKQDICEFLGLNSTPYLPDTFNIVFLEIIRLENLKAFHS